MSLRKFVFSQVMDLFPRWVLETAVKEYWGDFLAENLKSIKKPVYHLCIQTIIDPSSLSKANETTDYRILEDLDMWLIRKVRPMYAKEDAPDVYFPGWEIFAVDPTTIPCRIQLAEWLLESTRNVVSRCILYFICVGTFSTASKSQTAGITTAIYLTSTYHTNG